MTEIWNGSPPILTMDMEPTQLATALSAVCSSTSCILA